MTIKYSILMPYYKRRILHNTLVSYLHHYKDREDYEVIIVEDCKNASDKKEHAALINIVNAFSTRLKIKHLDTDFKNIWNPAPLFNVGARNAEGEFLVITNPECFHLTNILGEFDLVLEKDPGVYIIAGCILASFNGIINKFGEFKYKMIKWYQHSKHRNKKEHFCSVISKKLYDDIGGFDEEYSKGLAREDIDFVTTIATNGIKIILRDDLLVVHMKHERVATNAELSAINSKYYDAKWGSKSK